ncbi:MAG TPA: DUF72 domain-containing protein [Polyangiaceae bacterium]|nr:DUF72 domain-containing protein [Polyangiaceae bacterium]
MQVVVGQAALVGDFASYVEHFGALEVAWATNSAPKASRLERWRSQAPEGFVWSVVFPEAVAAIHELEPSAERLAETFSVAATLGAQWLLLKTPPAARPQTRVKERLKRFSELVKESERQLVWEPSGLWEARAAADLAEELGVTLAVDLSREAVEPSDVVYTRLRARGRALGENQLLRLLERLAGAEQAIVIVDGRGADQVQRWLREELQFSDDSEAASA